MPDDSPSLLSEFPQVPYERWRSKVDDHLDTPTLEGPTIRALYTAESGTPGPRPPARRSGWRVAQEYAQPDAGELSAMVRHDVDRGLESAWIRLHDDLRAAARTPAGRPGAMVDAASLSELVEAAGPGVSLLVDAGLAAPSLVDALVSSRGKGAEGGMERSDAVLCDPLALLLATGGLGASLDEAYAGLAQATRVGAGLRTVLVDAVVAHDAGASAEQEIAVAIAAGLEHLMRLDALGISPDEVMPRVVVRMSVGGDLMIEVAKLRALRRLWSRVRAHVGSSSGPAAMLWVRSSWRELTARDPWVNLLRGTAAVFAAVVGGASAIAVQPFTDALGRADADARRWALNTQHVLRGESHLGRVDDPAAGSWAFEGLTDALARGAWARVQSWLGRGGLAALILGGELQSELAGSAAARSQALATGMLTSVGTTAYPWLDEHRLDVPRIEPVEPGVDATPSTTAPPVRRRRPTEPFEVLRDRSDTVLRMTGKRPRALLVPVGPAAKARPQLDFARNVAAVGGFDSTVLTPESTLSERIQLAILCGPPDAMAQEGPPGVRRLIIAGVPRVIVVGRPTHELRDAGTHDFIHRRRDLLAVLTALHDGLLPTSTKEAAK